MYKQLHSLDPQALKGKHFRPYQNFLFAEQEMAVEILFRELSDAILALPLGFGRTATGDYKLMALLSVVPGKNTYINAQGQWIGGYVPAILRGYPFAAVAHPTAANTQVICIDEAAFAEPSDDTKPLFDEDDQPSKDVKDIVTFWEMIAQDRATTNAACAQLAAAELLIPWSIQVKEGDKTRPLEGFYCIDEERLNSLEAEAFANLRESGALAMAYAQLLSRSRVKTLQQATQQYARYQETMAALNTNLDDIFGEGDNDTLKFGF